MRVLHGIASPSRCVASSSQRSTWETGGQDSPSKPNTAPSTSGAPVRTASAPPRASASSPDAVPSMPTSTGCGCSDIPRRSHRQRPGTSAVRHRSDRSSPRATAGSEPMAAAPERRDDRSMPRRTGGAPVTAIDIPAIPQPARRERPRRAAVRRVARPRGDDEAAPARVAHRARGRSVACLFAEPSTRTRVSFEAAIFRLGALPIMLRPDELQLDRGEPIADTARVLSSYCDAIVVRMFAQRDVAELAEYASVPVINALTDDARSLPGARGLPDAARALRLAGRAAGRLRRRRQQRRSLADRGRRADRASSCASPHRRAARPIRRS